MILVRMADQYGRWRRSVQRRGEETAGSFWSVERAPGVKHEPTGIGMGDLDAAATNLTCAAMDGQRKAHAISSRISPPFRQPARGGRGCAISGDGHSLRTTGSLFDCR